MDINSELGNRIWQGTWLILPLYPWSNENTKQIYNRNIFQEMQKTNETFKSLKESLDKWVNFRNEIFGRHCINTEIYLMRENKRFSFGIYDNMFIIWNDFDEVLGEFSINENEIPSNEFIEWIENITKEYCEGIIHCSDCNKSITKKEIAGRYFAGVYCKDCWEREWKERESQETYE